MSFKIPSSLESLGFEPITDINRLEVGDFIVIPSMKEAPKLRMSVETLRRWGLSVTSGSNVRRYSCDNYTSARDIFGNPDSWSGCTDDVTRSHVLCVTSASHDKNSDFGKKRETVFTYENANSITDSKVTVEPPVYPIMTLSATPFRPFYTESANQSNRGYPISFAMRPDHGAYDMLTSKVGDAFIPTMNGIGKMRTQGFANLPFFLSVVSKICAMHGIYDDVLGGDQTKDIPGGFCRFNSVSCGASSVIMTAPEYDDEGRDYHCGKYFHCSNYEAKDRSLNMNRKFLANIQSRGALFYRSPGTHELSSRIMAKAVADNMSDRYDKLIAKMETLLHGLSEEMTTVKAIAAKFKSVSNELSTPEEILASAKKFF